MLTITSRALTVIRRVTDHPALDTTSGLRIARGADADGPLQVRAVPAPGRDDRVVEERGGGRLYLGPGVAERVAGGDLDATSGPRGEVQFVLRTAA